MTELARERGLHDAVHGRLMDAYWAEGRNIGDPDELRALAAEAGLEDVSAALAGDAYLDAVLDSTRQAQAIGVTGIPGFLLDRRLLVLGAQPDEVFEQAFARLAEPPDRRASGPGRRRSPAGRAGAAPAGARRARAG